MVKKSEIESYDDLVKLIGKEKVDKIVLERIMILIAEEQLFNNIKKEIDNGSSIEKIREIL